LRRGIGISIGLAVLVGIYLVAVGGWPIVIIGLSAIVALLLYTGGPLPYGYVGLGDLFVFLFFGLAAVTGTYYLQDIVSGSPTYPGLVPMPAFFVPVPVWIGAITMGCLTTAILVVNNLRDRHTDRAAGKYTLAVILGGPFARLQYAVLMIGGSLLPFIGSLVLSDTYGRGPNPALAMGHGSFQHNMSFWFASLWTLGAIYLSWRVMRTDGADLNPLLGDTAKHAFAIAMVILLFAISHHRELALQGVFYGG